MIRLPSFFKRRTQSDDLETWSVGRRTTKRAAPRAFQSAIDSEELALTEDPEQQRARHRLVGATVLILIAVIGLPRILDNKPKAVNNDIAVNIVTSLPAPNADPKPEPKAEGKAKVEIKQEASVESPKVATPAPEAKAEAKPAPLTPNKPAAIGLAAGEEVVAAPNSQVKYTIQVGSFVTEESIKNVAAKLKELKIPYFTKTTTKDGKKYIGYVAGPFNDRDMAEVAEKKIKANLYPAAKITESGKQ